MKILHFCPLPFYSGLEQYALMMALEQKKRGHEVVFVTQKNSVLEKECAKAGLNVELVDVYKRKASWSSIAQYRDLLTRHSDAEVVHTHTAHDIERFAMAYQFLRWKKSWRRPFTVQQNHIWVSHGKRDPIHWLTYKVLDQVWCSSGPAKRDLERYLPVPKDKIQIIPYGRDLRIKESFLSRQEARAQLGLSEGLIVGAIARIDKAKGIWELLQATLSCLKEGYDFTLVVIGGPTMSDPEAIAFSKKVEGFVSNLPEAFKSRVRLLGAIPDAAKYLKAFDVYAQASYKETFSLALLDAQLAELPVIGTDSGGTPEVVREGETGWLAKPESSKAFTDALRSALDAREWWKTFGKTARARVESSYELTHVMDEILARYKKSQ